MAVIVPLVLGGLALAVMAIVSMGAASRKRAQAGVLPVNQARILIHAINDDRCTGCDACVAVCPTNVLELIANKSRVERFQDCIQCEACMWACPTEALVMFPEGTQPPPVKVPDLDENFQTVIPGQYLIGEVAGKPLVKNAANLGRAVVEHMLKSGLRHQRGADLVDVLIVGSGPGGMSAALTCIEKELSYVVIEKENIISSTVSRYPKGKLVMAEPYDTENLSFLPIFDSQKEEIVDLWKSLASELGMNLKMHETVQSVEKQQDQSFAVLTTGGRYRAQRVVLATGTRGKPRALGVPGESLPKVESLLEDPDRHQGQAVLVVGGGDSALEAAMALASSGARVILSYRGRSFHRAQQSNKLAIARAAESGQVKVKLQSQVVEFAADTVTLQMSDGTQKRYPNDAAFVLIGADPPIRWLSTLGIHYVERPHMQPMPASDELVRSLASSPVVCPDNLQGAAALVRGEDVNTQEPKSRKASIGRRFVRSASSLFGLGDDHEPVPLSQFAKRAQTEGPRDQLEPEERTRILRMLRDEGGRRAYEDSQLIPIDPGLAESHHEPPQVRRGPGGLNTIQPPIALEGIDGKPPKPAVIVGLEKAAQEKGRRKKRSSRMRAPEVHEERTSHMSPEAARALLGQKPDSSRKPVIEEERTSHMSPEEARALLGTKAPSVRQPVLEEPTSLMNFDPAKIMNGEMDLDQAVAASRQAPQTPLEAPPIASGRRGLGDFEHEATRAVHMDDEVDLDDTGDRDLVFDDKTRVVDDSYQPRSLSEIDWDLD